MLLRLVQAFDADFLIGDVTYACSTGLSDLLRRPSSRPPIPRVLVSALPMLDPLMPGRQDSIPNALASIPQLGTGLTSHMVIGLLRMVGFIVLVAYIHPCSRGC